MYAIIRTGGKQYKVSPGDVIHVEKLAGDAGSVVEFHHVFAVRKEALKVGKPLVDGAKVTGVIVRNGQAKKVRVLKYKEFSEVLIKEVAGA
jgi:large subunit ribosomal protein L21